MFMKSSKIKIEFDHMIVENFGTIVGTNVIDSAAKFCVNIRRKFLQIKKCDLIHVNLIK